MSTNQRVVAPLTDEEASGLLLPHEVVRDPVQHDITITALERRIIDTSAFQRLRALKQLGPTDLVYPGAIHTRFNHSLGVLKCADELVRITTHNYKVYNQPAMVEVGPYPHLLVRLTALLHDVAHIPYGHTLEDEGNLTAPEWEDSARLTHWLGERSEIAKAILGFLGESGISDSSAKAVLEDVRSYVHHKNPTELQYPFVTDFVGNTLCADLLDYLDRDMYFCGLRERSGDRVISYASVLRLQADEKRDDGQAEYRPCEEAEEGKGRVVLLTYRFEQGHLAHADPKAVDKFEILSEAIDLLRRRFALAEKVYFHRTKLAASAMLISAMGSSTIEKEKLYSLSDGEFVGELLSDSSPRTKRLGNAFRARRLFKPVYRLKYLKESDADLRSKELWSETYPRFRDPELRAEVEEKLEKYARLPAGSIAIYCPDRRMNLKEFKMLVQSRPGGEVKELRNILDENRKSEMEAINLRFAQLWSLWVYVDPDALDVSQVSNERVQDLNALCEHLVAFPNGIAELQGKGRKLREQLAARAIEEYQDLNGRTVPFNLYTELVSADHRQEGLDILESMRKHLEAAMGPTQLKLDTGGKK